MLDFAEIPLDMAGQDEQTALQLSTPDTHAFEQHVLTESTTVNEQLPDERLYITYEIERTLESIRKCRYQRVALQFPDHMLKDAPRVVRLLQTEPSSQLASAGHEDVRVEGSAGGDSQPLSPSMKPRFFILGDTSYAPCCVDEIAAEHADADVVVHYGRTCLSPTTRVPAIYVFTKRPWSWESFSPHDFESLYPDRSQRILLVADVMYQEHLALLNSKLRNFGYENIHSTEIIHDPSSLIPNRTLPSETQNDPAKLAEWHLFYIGDPPASLLLIVSSRVSSFQICPLRNDGGLALNETIRASSSRALNRRYALLTSASTEPIIGILINTLSVKDYQDVVERVKAQISAAGKKAYTFVVGKLNAAKVANFAEVGAWVVIGCWESSLVESKDFWRPLITPFELGVALQGDERRVWTGEWTSNFQEILKQEKSNTRDLGSREEVSTELQSLQDVQLGANDWEDEEESAPPEFDLRTGRYVSQARPMKPPPSTNGLATLDGRGQPRAVMRRGVGDVATVGGVPSPGADYLRTNRTWQGLGSDFVIAYEEVDTRIEEGRSGIARGYRHGEGEERR